MARKSTTASSSAPKKPSKKASSRAKTTKKTTKSGATKKKATAKKPTTKKSTTKKAESKSTTKKKSSAAKKSSAKKSTTKKTAKKTTKKAAASKATASKLTKKTTKKPASGKKPSTSKSKKAPSKKKAETKAAAETPKEAQAKFRGFKQESSLTEMRAAAAKLASLAGLPSVKTAHDNDAIGTKKFRKVTKSPLNAKQLAEFKEILLLKRRQLEGDVSSMELEALMGGGSGSLSHLPQHMADQGSDVSEQSLSLDLAASQRDLMREIDAALERIENGTYGICTVLGKPIKIERLREAPWARYSIEAARDLERTGRFHRPGIGQ